jgi:MSHA pilin protein MshC
MLWRLSLPKHKIAQGGFTLLELIIVMVILGILAVFAIPKFSGASGYSEYTYQNRLISVLRNMQIRAMQDSRIGFCHQINFVSTSTQVAFGPTTSGFATANNVANCNTSIDFTSPEFLRTSATEMIDASVSMTAVDGTTAISGIHFNSFGSPVTSVSNCSSSCTVSFTGISTAQVCIESEGFIHAC